MRDLQYKRCDIYVDEYFIIQRDKYYTSDINKCCKSTEEEQYRSQLK